MRSITVLLAVAVSVVLARPQQQQQQQSLDSFGGSRSSLSGHFTTSTTPKPQIPILRHISRVNNDGSYTFGYESGDGSYRVETRGLDGVTKGKYGYVDENGILKEVDYLAGKDTGYEPSGVGITVPPRPPPRPPGQEFLDYDDGSGTSTTPRNRVRGQQQTQQQQHQQQPQFVQQPAPRPQPAPQVVHQPPPPPPPPAPQPQFFAPQQPTPQQHQQIAFQPQQQQQQSFQPQVAQSAHHQVASFQAPQGGRNNPSPIEAFLRQQLAPGQQRHF